MKKTDYSFKDDFIRETTLGSSKKNKLLFMSVLIIFLLLIAAAVLLSTYRNTDNANVVNKIESSPTKENQTTTQPATENNQTVIENDLPINNKQNNSSSFDADAYLKKLEEDIANTEKKRRQSMFLQIVISSAQTSIVSGYTPYSATSSDGQITFSKNFNNRIYSAYSAKYGSVSLSYIGEHVSSVNYAGVGVFHCTGFNNKLYNCSNGGRYIYIRHSFVDNTVSSSSDSENSGTGVDYWSDVSTHKLESSTCGIVTGTGDIVAVNYIYHY